MKTDGWYVVSRVPLRGAPPLALASLLVFHVKFSRMNRHGFWVGVLAISGYGWRNVIADHHCLGGPYAGQDLLIDCFVLLIIQRMLLVRQERGALPGAKIWRAYYIFSHFERNKCLKRVGLPALASCYYACSTVSISRMGVVFLCVHLFFRKAWVPRFSAAARSAVGGEFEIGARARCIL